jgi:arabinogalactan oligomer/maltooligosaccharide transport system substrate-binding protein
MKTYRWTGALVALALILSACGTTGASPTAGGASPTSAATGAEPTEGGTAEPTMAGEPLSGSLTFWHAYSSGGAAEGEALNQVLAKIQAESPELALTVLDVPFNELYTKFETEAAAGGGPDLYIAPNDNLGNEVRAGLLEPLDDALADTIDENLEVAVEGSKVDGTLYMVPESLKAVAMFYDSSKVAEPPATTDDLLEGVRDGSIALGINQNPYHNWGFWYAFGGQILDDSDQCVADQGGVADAMAYLKELKDAGAQFFTDGAAFQDAFKTGAVNVIIEGPWFTGDAKKALADNLGVAPMPEGPAGVSQPMTGVDGWYINKNSANKELAIAFAKRMVAVDSEQVFVDVAGHIPANSSIQIQDPITDVFSEAVAEGFPRPQSAGLGNYWTPFGDALNKVLDTSADPQQAVADACATMNTPA